MEIMEYHVIMVRTEEIEREQLSSLDYLCDKIDFIIKEQKENIRERMLPLR